MNINNYKQVKIRIGCSGKKEIAYSQKHSDKVQNSRQKRGKKHVHGRTAEGYCETR